MFVNSSFVHDVFVTKDHTSLEMFLLKNVHRVRGLIVASTVEDVTAHGIRLANSGLNLAVHVLRFLQRSGKYATACVWRPGTTMMVWYMVRFST
jgi:hypothetical protein